MSKSDVRIHLFVNNGVGPALRDAVTGIWALHLRVNTYNLMRRYRP